MTKKALKKELEVKYPKVLMHLFPNKKVRLSVTTYYTLKEEQESLYENEQEMFAINEDWNSDITKVFGKQFLTYTRSSQFLNDNDIDIGLMFIVPLLCADRVATKSFKT